MNASMLRKAIATNANSSGFTAKTTFATARPTGNLVLPLAGFRGGRIPKSITLWPYGLGSDNDVFSLRIWAWYPMVTTAGLEWWLPAMIGEFVCTLSTFIGAAGQPVLNTERMCDTISLVALVGEATVTADTTRSGTVHLYSPANDTPAWVKVPLIGRPELLEFDFDQTTGTPTANALYSLHDC